MYLHTLQEKMASKMSNPQHLLKKLTHGVDEVNREMEQRFATVDEVISRRQRSVDGEGEDGEFSDSLYDSSLNDDLEGYDSKLIPN